MPIDDLMIARERIRAAVQEYRERPAFLLVANHLTDARPDVVRDVALFDTAAQAADYEAAARLAEERGRDVPGEPRRFYREGTLLRDFVMGIWIPETDGSEEKRRALMIQVAPIDQPGLEELPRNPAPWRDPSDEAAAMAAGAAVLGLARERPRETIPTAPPEEGVPMSDAADPLSPNASPETIAYWSRNPAGSNNGTAAPPPQSEPYTPEQGETRPRDAHPSTDGETAWRGIPEGSTWIDLAGSEAPGAPAKDQLPAMPAWIESNVLGDKPRWVCRRCFCGVEQETEGESKPEIRAEFFAQHADCEEPHLLDPDRLRSFLMMVSVDVPRGFCEALDEDRRRDAQRWATATHLCAGDHDDIVVPLQPFFLRPYYRVSPALPLGWKPDEPKPPPMIEQCRDLDLLRACAIASLRRVVAAYEGTDHRIATRRSDAIRDIETIAHPREWEHGSIPPIDPFQVRLLHYFATEPPPLLALHFDDASRFLRQIGEVVGAKREERRRVLRAAAAHHIRRALDPRTEEDETGIWTGCISVFPNLAVPRIAALQRAHLDVARPGEPVGPIIARLDVLCAETTGYRTRWHLGEAISLLHRAGAA